MATSTPNPPSREPTLEQRQHMTDSFGSFIHNTSLAALVVAPVLILLPPRKLDLYTFLLSGAFVASANQISKERTGYGLLYHLPGGGSGVSAQTKEFQTQLRAQKEQKRLLEESAGPNAADIHASKQRGTILEQKAREIWMGGETEGWKERRLKEEQEKLAQGEGYGSMIMDQIWEVWNWGEKKAEDLKEKDQVVVAAEAKLKKEEQRTREFPKIGKD